MHLRRTERLRLIGVEWGKAFDARWQELYGSLIQYKEQFGYCDLDLNIVRETHRKLSNWAGNQRDFQQNGTLMPERQAMLNRVGFTWHGRVGSVRSKVKLSKVLRPKRKRSIIEDSDDVESLSSSNKDGSNDETHL